MFRVQGTQTDDAWRRIVLVACSLVSAIVLLAMPIARSADPPNDFAFYWTAANLALDGKNPYSVTDTLDLQRRLSFPGKGRLIMRNPPWVFPLIAPFGLLSFSTARSLWFLFGLTLTLTSVHWLWELYGADERRWVGWVVASTFLPVAVALNIGQIGPLVLFGLAGFLRFEAKQYEYAAGAFLFLVALKPHLVFLLWAALLLHTLYRRQWKSIVAFLVMLALASLLAIVLDRGVFSQYAQLFGAERVLLEETPTLGGLLRHVSGFPLVQFVPAGVGIVWFGWCWMRWRSSWEWRFRMPSLLLVSMVTTTYAWFFDQMILLPSVLYATVLVIHSRRHLFLGILVTHLIISCVIVVLLVTHRTTFWYSWTALAWLVNCAVAQEDTKKHPPPAALGIKPA